VEGGEGEPLLLLHGFTGSWRAWGDSLLVGLARRRWVLALDLPGHGSTSVPDDPAFHTLSAVVATCVRVLDRRGIRDADWLGYSMGGRMALGAAVMEPERVRRLILESASPGLEHPEERALRRESDARRAAGIETGGVEAFVEEWLSLPLFATQARLPPRVRARERTRRLGNRARGLAASLRGAGTGNQPSFWGDLPGLRIPVLLLSGGDDLRYGEVAGRMASRLPSATHRVVVGAGHAVHLERPREWLLEVGRFLEGRCTREGSGGGRGTANGGGAPVPP